MSVGRIDPPRRLHGHETLRVSAAAGGGALVLGGLCLALGAFIILIAYDRLPFNVPPPNGPPWLMASVGAIFAIPGVWLCVAGSVGFVRKRSAARAALKDPFAPWLWDHPWDPRGIADDSLRRLGRGSAALVSLAAFLVPFNALAFTKVDSWFMRGVVGLFDLLLLAGLGTMLYRLLAELRYGRTRLEFAHFPFRLGQSLDVVLRLSRVPGRPRRLTCTVVCIEEHTESVDTSDGTEVRLAAFEHFRDEQSPEAGHAHDAFSRGGLKLSFALPAEPGLATSFTGGGLRYWLLEVKGDLSGIDLHKRYLLPVY
jgi:hypothetical protein